MTIKYFLSLIIALSFLTVSGQKKLVPDSESELTGIVLPAGSKKDKRWLSEVSGKTLLEMESKKANTGVKNTELFYLPPVASSGFNEDSLVAQLTALGWEITPIESDNKYVWLQKSGRYIIAYFSMDKKDTQLYFGEALAVPTIPGG